MPVAHRINNHVLLEYDRLVEQLLREWHTPDESKQEPLIIEEAPSDNDRVNHLYVIWSEWASLTPFERSKLIMQTYKRLRGGDLASNITLAMGLTPSEAEQMNMI